MSAGDDSRYARDVVERLDRDRALILKLAPEAVQHDLAILFAFNLEVARVREAVSEAGLGEIRLQWWRDALDEIQVGNPRRHPIVQGMDRVMKRHDLARPLLDAVIDARSRDLESQPFATEAERDAYLDATNGGLLVLAGQILGARDGASEQALRRVGLAHGLTGMMRAMPILLQMRRAVLTLEGMEAAGLSQEEAQLLRGSPALRIAVKASVRRAEDALRAARQAACKADPATRPLFALAAMARHAANRLRRAAYDPFAPAMAPQNHLPVGVSLRILLGRW